MIEPYTEGTSRRTKLKEGSYKHRREKIKIELSTKRGDLLLSLTTTCDSVNGRFFSTTQSTLKKSGEILEELDKMEKRIDEQKQLEQEAKSELEKVFEEKKVRTGWL